ncbi:MAG: hypothetical protein D6717_00095, partial [Gammaproteobacteria bacterium]
TTLAEAGGDNGQLDVILSATNGTGGPITVNFSRGGVAQNNVDYTDIGLSVQIAAGSDRTSIALTGIDDTLLEGDEDLTVTLTGASDAAISIGAPGIVTATVTDDENSLGAVVASLYTVTGSASENPQASGQLLAALSATNATGGPISIWYTIGGTASGGSDYTALSGTAIVADGVTSVAIAIDPIDDVLLEGAEDVVLTVTGTSWPTVAVDAFADTATVTIADDESAAGAVTAWIQAIDLSAYEATDTASIAVILSATNETGAPVTVSFVTGGRAINGTDYANIGSSVQIANSAISTVITLSPTDDNLFEDTEDIVVTLTGASSAAITRAAPYSVTATIIDDEADQATDN